MAEKPYSYKSLCHNWILKKHPFGARAQNPAIFHCKKTLIVGLQYHRWSHLTPFLNLPCGAGAKVTSLGRRGPLGRITVVV